MNAGAMPSDHSAALAVGHELLAVGIDALVVAIAEGELRYTCSHCDADTVAADLGSSELDGPELDRRLRQHLADRHKIPSADIRFWDGREAAAEARARAAEVTGG